MLNAQEQAEYDRLLDENEHFDVDQPDAPARLADLSARIAEFDDRIRVARSSELVAGVRSGRMRVDHGIPDTDSSYIPSALGQRGTALRALDAAVSDNRLAARGAELVETLIDTGPGPQRSWTARYAAATGSRDYETAFAKLLGNPTQGHLTWTQDEADAFRAVEALRSETRAMSTADVSGGFMIPLTLDPAVMLTSDGSTNPLRQLARVVQTTTDSWSGVTSAGVTAEWTAEAAEVADASPSLGQPVIPVYKGDAFVPFSFEVQKDALGFLDELGRLLRDGADQLTAAAYTNGSGTGQPRGVVSALVDADATVPLIDPIATETLAAADIYAVQNALGPRFQPRASWCANLAILNTIRQFETSNGALKFPELAASPPMLLGRPVYENSNMDGGVDAAETADNYILVYGDFAAGMVIVDRIGSTLEIVPHLFGPAGRRPTGQRGALLWFRTGSDVVVPQAFRMLSIPTTSS